MSIVAAVKALGNERRLLILEWLKDPEAHFPRQVDGDLVKDGFVVFQATGPGEYKLVPVQVLGKSRQFAEVTGDDQR